MDSNTRPDTDHRDEAPERSDWICPSCGGHLIEIHGVLQCERCHTITETCCEGVPWIKRKPPKNTK